MIIRLNRFELSPGDELGVPEGLLSFQRGGGLEQTGFIFFDDLLRLRAAGPADAYPSELTPDSWKRDPLGSVVSIHLSTIIPPARHRMNYGAAYFTI